MIDDAWAFKSALEQARAIAARQVKPSELVALYYERIGRIDPELNAYVLLTRELAESQAAASEKRVTRGEQLGLLDGVPVSIKETAALAGYRNSLGSRVFEKSIAQVDSFAIGRLKDEGAVILGKTNAPEFGTRPITEGPMFPPARNPVDVSRTAGGSSGGAAAAVAAGLCALSHGGDGGGSIRIPASCCGVVGLKPSRGRISSGPLLGEDWAGLATSGVIARTVADAALGLDAMSGHLPGDPYWAEITQPFLPAAVLLEHLVPQRLGRLRVRDAPGFLIGERHRRVFRRPSDPTPSSPASCLWRGRSSSSTTGASWASIPPTRWRPSRPPASLSAPRRRSCWP